MPLHVMPNVTNVHRHVSEVNDRVDPADADNNATKKIDDNSVETAENETQNDAEIDEVNAKTNVDCAPDLNVPDPKMDPDITTSKEDSPARGGASLARRVASSCPLSPVRDLCAHVLRPLRVPHPQLDTPLCVPSSPLRITSGHVAVRHLC
jgi:hypothetical protein